MVTVETTIGAAAAELPTLGEAAESYRAAVARLDAVNGRIRRARAELDRLESEQYDAKAGVEDAARVLRKVAAGGNP